MYNVSKISVAMCCLLSTSAAAEAQSLNNYEIFSITRKHRQNPNDYFFNALKIDRVNNKIYMCTVNINGPTRTGQCRNQHASVDITKSLASVGRNFPNDIPLGQPEIWFVDQRTGHVVFWIGPSGAIELQDME